MRVLSREPVGGESNREARPQGSTKFRVGRREASLVFAAGGRYVVDVRRVLGLPAYRRLLAAYTLNEVAYSIGSLALAVLVYNRTGSALAAAGYFLCAMFGPALVSPVVVARLDQRPS